ncbi:hypothetical protein OROGR_028838 [Orobanche gracilis]
MKNSDQNYPQNIFKSILFPFMKTSLFLILTISSLLILFLGVPLLCIILILKPHMPDFSIKTVHVKSYKLDISSENLMVSSFFSVHLIAENPNKVGLSYDPCRFHVLSRGLVVGLIRIPEFHQPPSSKNVSVETRVSLESVNVSEMMYGSSEEDGDDPSSGVSGLRMLGDVRVHVRVFRIASPKVKIALDCNINVNQSRFSFNSEVHGMKSNHNPLISIPFNSQTVFKKCSIAIVV